MTKSTKSHLRGLSSLLENTFRVHELVARAMRGACVRQMAERKPAILPLPTVSAIPRVRTYHTKKPSRFVHALPARPLKVQGGREFSLSADGTTVISLISLCSHTDAHPNLNREVRHSPTWHSSESESALERFEPVAVVQQLPDGRGSVFARVAARRQGRDFKESGKLSLMTFAALFVSEKREKRKVSSSIFAGEQCSPPCLGDADFPPTQNHTKIKNFSKNLDMFTIVW